MLIDSIQISDPFWTVFRPIIFVSLMGDFNARLGPDLVNFTFNDHTNRNGEKLFDLMEEYDIFSANNYFMKPKSHQWTYESPRVIVHN